MPTTKPQPIADTSAERAARTVLKPGTIYCGDNGQRICIHCAGQSALYTGRDRSGMRVEPMTAEDAVEWLEMTGKPLACERGCTVYGASKEVTAQILCAS